MSFPVLIRWWSKQGRRAAASRRRAAAGAETLPGRGPRARPPCPAAHRRPGPGPARRPAWEPAKVSGPGGHRGHEREHGFGRLWAARQPAWGPRRRARGDTGQRGACGQRGTGRSTGSGAGPEVARARRLPRPPAAGLGRPNLRLLPPRTRPPCSTVAFSSAPPRSDGRGRRPMGAASPARCSERERVDRGQGGARAGCGRWPSCRDRVARALGLGWGLRDRVLLCHPLRAWGCRGRAWLPSILSLGCRVDSSGNRS